MDKKDCEVGKQVMYSNGNVQAWGFITSWDALTVSCRFWSDYNGSTLKTITASDACLYEELQPCDLYPQEKVDKVIAMLRAQPEKYGWFEQPEAAHDRALRALREGYDTLLGNAERYLDEPSESNRRKLYRSSIELRYLTSDYRDQVTKAGRQ